MSEKSPLRTQQVKRAIVKYAPIFVLPPIGIGAFVYGLELADGFVFPGVVALLLTSCVLLPIALFLEYLQQVTIPAKKQQ